MLGRFLPVVPLSGGTGREGCCLNIEQPSWESGPQALCAVGGGDEVKEQVCGWQQGLELKKINSCSVFDTESLLQVVLSRAGCSTGEMWSGAAGLWLDQAGLARRHLLGKLLWGWRVLGLS